MSHPRRNFGQNCFFSIPRTIQCYETVSGSQVFFLLNAKLQVKLGRETQSHTNYVQKKHRKTMGFFEFLTNPKNHRNTIFSIFVTFSEVRNGGLHKFPPGSHVDTLMPSGDTRQRSVRSDMVGAAGAWLLPELKQRKHVGKGCAS